MGYVLCQLTASEDKIIILGAVEFLAETARLFNQALFYHEKMADVIVGTQKIQIKIRLQMRLIMFTQILSAISYSASGARRSS